MNQIRHSILQRLPTLLKDTASSSWTNPALKAADDYTRQGLFVALEDTDVNALRDWLTTVPPEVAGFAAEGVGIGLTLLDYFTPWRRYRLQAINN